MSEMNDSCCYCVLTFHLARVSGVGSAAVGMTSLSAVHILYIHDWLLPPMGSVVRYVRTKTKQSLWGRHQSDHITLFETHLIGFLCDFSISLEPYVQ